MSHTAGDSPGPIDPVEISEDAVLLDRDIEVQAEGVVITYRLTTDGGEPATTTVTDEIPADLSMDEAGFHPDNEPYEWSIDDHDVTFETVVPEKGERIVVFGIAHPNDPPSDLSFADPLLSGVDSVNPAVSEEDIDITLPDVDEPDRADAIAEVIQGTNQPEGTSADGGESREASSDEIEAALEGLSETGSQDESVHVEEPEESTTEDDTDAPTETIDLEDGPTTPAPEPDDPAPSEESLTEALLADLRRDEVSKQDRAALADLLFAAVEGPTVDSLDVRLNHVQTRMDDYAAFADALEEIIDEYGTADGFMAEIRETVDMVDERVEDIHERLDELESQVDRVAEESADHDDISALDDEVEELRSDVKAVKQVRDTLLEAFTDE